MKILYSSLACMMLLSTLFGGCNNKSSATTEDSDSLILNEEALDGKGYWSDSIIWDENHSTHVSIDIDCNITDNAVLRDSVLRWIAQQLDTNAKTNTLQELAELCGRKQFTKDSTEVIEFMRDEPDMPYMCYEYEQQIKVIFQNEDYITLQQTLYTFTGGAHGSTIVTGATFRKSDGKEMGWNLLANMPDITLSRKIKQGLKEYFGVTTDEELRDNLMLYSEDELIDPFDDEFFPRPAVAPYLTADGICLIYQQYEIACYAAGMPCVVIK